MVPATQLTNTGQANPIGHIVWMSGRVFIDPASLEYRVLPDHQANTHYNVLGWLEQGPCTNCFQITSVVPSGTGTILVGIKVAHPFTNLNLTGFDVRAIAMFNGSRNFPTAGLNASSRALGDPELVNADGFTSLYNPTTAGSGPAGLQGYIQGKLASKTSTPTALLNGFKRLFSPTPGNTRNALLAGSNGTGTLEIDKPAGPLTFGYAVDANWAPPISKPVDDPMTDFGPEANCPEPWKIILTEEKIGDGLTDAGGSTKLVIDVYDYTGKDSHDSPKVECPELFDGSLTASFVQDFGGYARYEVTGQNAKLAGVGTYMTLVKVVDNEDASAPDWLDLTAYQIIKLSVISLTKLPPVALASADILTPDVDQTVHFSDNGSYDPDGGAIVTFEWDWENDGIFDQTGSNVTHAFASPGAHLVQMRVTDDESATDTLDTPLSITVNAVSVTWTNTIKDMLNANCGSCHVQGSSGGVSFQTYLSTMEVVVPGDPMSSLIYTNIYQGDHFGHLSPADLDTLYNWILNGAPEN
jgi:PKD repeat protein